MADDGCKQATKNKYESPVITKISLRPEEAVLGNCKTMTTGAGPGGSTCIPLSNCFTIGS